MIIFPAIDIRGGRCVRLIQGDYAQESVYGDPVQMAEKWAQEGGQYLHVIDLDGARSGVTFNLPVIQAILEKVQVPVQLGGGIRSLTDLETVFDAGVSRAILGSAALKDPVFLETAVQKYSDKVAVSVDARDGMVATDGWTETS